MGKQSWETVGIKVVCLGCEKRGRWHPKEHGRLKTMECRRCGIPGTVAREASIRADYEKAYRSRVNALIRRGVRDRKIPLTPREHFVKTLTLN